MTDVPVRRAPVVPQFLRSPHWERESWAEFVEDEPTKRRFLMEQIIIQGNGPDVGVFTGSIAGQIPVQTGTLFAEVRVGRHAMAATK